jgi:hypothetical protein
MMSIFPPNFYLTPANHMTKPAPEPRYLAQPLRATPKKVGRGRDSLHIPVLVTNSRALNGIASYVGENMVSSSGTPLIPKRVSETDLFDINFFVLSLQQGRVRLWKPDRRRPDPRRRN